MTPDDAASKKKTAAPGKRRRLQSGGAVFGRFHQLGREEAYRGTGGAIKWQTTSDKCAMSHKPQQHWPALKTIQGRKERHEVYVTVPKTVDNTAIG